MKINTKTEERNSECGCVLPHLFYMRYVGPYADDAEPDANDDCEDDEHQNRRIKHLLIADGPAWLVRALNWFFIFVRNSNNCDHQHGNKSSTDSRGNEERCVSLSNLRKINR